MRAFGVIIGILISILGGYAIVLEMDLFLNLGWLLGILFILSGIMLLIPKLKEIKQSWGKKKEPQKMVKEKPVKKDNTKNILGAISVAIGIILLISGVTKTITDLGIVYLVGACVMFYGVIQLSALTKTPKEEETGKTSKKRKKKVQEPERKKNNKTMIVCCVISLLIGGLAIYSSFISFISVKELVAYNIVMQGINVVVIALDTYKKGERA